MNANGEQEGVPVHTAPDPGGDDSMDGRVRLATDLLRSGRGLHYLAHCGAGRRDFDLDLLADADLTGADEQREACRKIAEKLSFQTARHLNDWLSVLRTGPLIRTVLQGRHGAIYCDQIVPGSYLVGATVGLSSDSPQPVSQPVVSQADEALSQLVEEIRERIHLRRLDLGGWDSERIRSELRAAEPRRPEPVADIGQPQEETGAIPIVSGDAGHPGLSVCHQAVRLRDLHLVTLFADSAPVFSVDVLHDERLGVDDDGQLSIAVRRERYQAVGAQLPDYVRELGRTARPAIGGPVLRAVLDVERGAVYYHRLDQARYLLGVTLYQDQVKSAEDRLAGVVDSWPRH